MNLATRVTAAAASRHGIVLTLLLAAAAPPARAAEPAPPATTQAGGDVAVRVQSARVARTGVGMQKLFPNRYYNDGNPAVMIQLLLSLKDALLLPPGREAITIDTFVDDTYQTLAGGGPEEGRYDGGQAPLVSDDGRHLMFTVGSRRAIAEDATRVFVRGSVHARVARGELKTDSGTLPLTAGQEVPIGPFKATIKSIADAGRNMTINVAVTGDAARIRKTRALSKDGKPLNEEREARFIDQGGGGNPDTGAPERPAMLHLNIPPAQESITLEFTHAEKLENVRIPFEAQVDVGVVKAGPIELREARPGGGGGGGGVRSRPWPPPPTEQQLRELPRRRAAFDPTAPPAATTAPGAAPAPRKLEKAAVDVFSLTVAKAAPEEQKDVKWANAPWAGFRASGFLVARLMLSTPDASILSVPPDGVLVSRYEDDKGGALDTTVYRDTTASSYGFNRSFGLAASPDGQQALLTLSMATPPTPGATRCTLGGRIRATVARGERTDASDAVPFARGQEFAVGPINGSFAAVRPIAPTTPGGTPEQIEAQVTLRGPVVRVRSFELLDAKTNAVLTSRRDLSFMVGGDRAEADSTSFTILLPPPATQAERVIIRIRHHDKAETVEVPFEISAGIGL